MTKSYVYITDTIIKEILSFIETLDYRVKILSPQAKTSTGIIGSHQLRFYLIPYKILALSLVSICKSVYIGCKEALGIIIIILSSFRFVICILVRPLKILITLIYTAPRMRERGKGNAGGCPPSVSALYCHGSS